MLKKIEKTTVWDLCQTTSILGQDLEPKIIAPKFQLKTLHRDLRYPKKQFTQLKHLINSGASPNPNSKYSIKTHSWGIYKCNKYVYIIYTVTCLRYIPFQKQIVPTHLYKPLRGENSQSTNLIKCECYFTCILGMNTFQIEQFVKKVTL